MTISSIYKSLTIYSLFICFGLSHVTAQYNFKTEKRINCTEVKSQDRTGTCWSFATASFLESELIRMGHDNINLSEMFIVRNIYKDKAMNYVMRQGKANFSQGSLSHDLIRMTEKHGLITEDAYSGLINEETKHDHSEMEAGLKGFLDGIRKSKKLSTNWKPAFAAIIDTYMGAVPKQFMHDGVAFTPKSFVETTKLKTDNYISLGSFTHHPFYEEFILEIPDNYSNGEFYNVPLKEMMSIIDYAILAGYSIAWDGDVSEKGFSAKNGMALLPENAKREDLFTMPGKEIEVTQENRQSNFENYSTTDDHLMHLVGMALDQNGTKYYIIKNSWGEISDFKGYLYMSENYLKMKTISVMIHKDGLPSDSSKRLFESE
ncbi:MAG: bleomycin hydrolase [Saprospiraceae bacterium]|jgi:bleomycin hydrolase